MKDADCIIYKTFMPMLLFIFVLCSAQAFATNDDNAHARLENYCKDVVGAPRVEKIADGVWAAISYDLASTVLIQTSEGNVIVDTGMSPERARKMRAALEEATPPAPTAAIIYTHSHIDHIGGATVWADENTKIWGTSQLPAHIFKQYGYFREIETLRGGRQFGRHVKSDDMRCSGLGARVDIDAALENGVMLPTNTFDDEQTLVIGGVTLSLKAAPGETHDALFVWLPDTRTIIAGDNFYWSFPNLYTLRGASPRPVDEWIKSIDAMRALNPEHLAPNHTLPVHGSKKIAEALTGYRDAIQWVRDDTIRRANRGETLDMISENVALPERLAALPFNGEFYGRVDWSAKAIFTNNLGWFDGRPEELYPLPHKVALSKEIDMMGGREAVFKEASAAFERGEYRWAARLLAKLIRSDDGRNGEAVKELLAKCYERLASETYNTNGRAYLLESAFELRNGIVESASPNINERLMESVPLERIFDIMILRLNPGKAMNIHETVVFDFTDENKRFIVTVRNGIAEVVHEKPLPGTPKPVATVTTDGGSYRRMAAGLDKPAAMLASGKLKVTGNMSKLMEFMTLFDTGI